MFEVKSVNDHIYRSRMPTTWAEVEVLKKLGIKKIINLQGHLIYRRKCVYYKKEAKLQQDYGITVEYIPLSALTVPRLTQLERIYTALSTAPDKTLIHCKHGVDRTGMSIAYWKIKQGIANLDDAIHDMLEHGFHVRWLRWWIPYFKEYFQPPKKGNKQ